MLHLLHLEAQWSAGAQGVFGGGDGVEPLNAEHSAVFNFLVECSVISSRYLDPQGFQCWCLLLFRWMEFWKLSKHLDQDPRHALGAGLGLISTGSRTSRCHQDHNTRLWNWTFKELESSGKVSGCQQPQPWVSMVTGCGSSGQSQMALSGIGGVAGGRGKARRTRKRRPTPGSAVLSHPSCYPDSDLAPSLLFQHPSFSQSPRLGYPLRLLKTGTLSHSFSSYAPEFSPQIGGVVDQVSPEVSRWFPVENHTWPPRRHIANVNQLWKWVSFLSSFSVCPFFSGQTEA